MLFQWDTFHSFLTRFLLSFFELTFAVHFVQLISKVIKGHVYQQS